MSTESSYINYLEVLELPEDCKSGEAIRAYKKKMKDLVIEIARVEITEERRSTFLLEMARLNAAYYILRDKDLREKYLADRAQVMQIEEEWRATVEKEPASEDADRLRRSYDTVLRHFLSTYMEELMLEAGRDKECVEASHWDAAHERLATRVLRHYRQQLYREIHERLPYYEVTQPDINWDERKQVVAELLKVGG